MNVKISTKNKRGFTIIEVVLVLAIAGLIFLMVFIALPALQRSQRDTQRRDDYGMLSAAITNYSASNGGKLTNLYESTKCRKLDPATYINKEGTDPDGYQYTLYGCSYDQFVSAIPSATGKPGNSTGSGNNATTGSVVYVVIGADCTGNQIGTKAYDFTVPTKNTSSRAFAIYGYLESGSQTYCSASQ